MVIPSAQFVPGGTMQLPNMLKGTGRFVGRKEQPQEYNRAGLVPALVTIKTIEYQESLVSVTDCNVMLTFGGSEASTGVTSAAERMTPRRCV